MTREPIDALELAATLIRCPSVTPEDAGALDIVQQALEGLGFHCTRLPFSEAGTATVDNLYARLGEGAPHLCFAGHVDVVPVGAADDWERAPFSGHIDNGCLWGRGAADMKGAIAAFIAAISRYLAQKPLLHGSISLLITGDEEGPAINGTAKMVAWLKQQKQTITHCLVGEPTNPQEMGDMIKIGRRGSVNGTLVVEGTQGHVAYPHLAQNPVTDMLRLLAHLADKKLDAGTPHFQPSNLEVTTIDVNNPTTNLIPARAQARFNIRYNDLWTRDSLDKWVHDALAEIAINSTYTLRLAHSGEAFLTTPDGFVESVGKAVQEITGKTPELSTTGGTSDARFIKDICPVIEFGLVGKTMHKINEHVPVSDIEQLTQIYRKIIAAYFA